MTSTVADRRRAIDAALDELGDLASADQPLAPLTTYKVGGSAAIFSSPTGVDQLAQVSRVATRHGLDLMVIGRGSNLLVADTGFAGVVISLAAMPAKFEIRRGDNGSVEVDVDGAAALPVVSRRLAAAGVSGFEWAVGVPGSIGGAVRMNAGGHGSDMSAVVAGIHLFDARSGHHGWVPAERLGFRFRGSDVADHHLVLEARLALHAGDRQAGEAQLSEIVRWRREHQPGGQNAGSVFVNPVPGQIAAAALVDRLGMRGLRIGGAAVSDKHANFIQADEGAAAADVRAVIDAVRSRVLERTGIALRGEIHLVGFDDEAGSAEVDQ